MLTSARNQFTGKVAAIHPGVVNDEIDIALPGGNKITAVITQRSTANLGLAVGGEALAIIKAPWVVLANPEAGIKLSTRNRLEGRVSALRPGAVNTEVEIRLNGGDALVAIVTKESADSLDLAVGKAIVAFFKASHVIVGVHA
ncbi:TOBE domain-containing protein [Chromobacterium haemolyticum]|uniref:TOBE domain-containing protein n=1 Tax=Chromobacterium haemolyticum TaxID=394935 RepID=UPI0024481E3B|nr:TOBE domain-containing protein [Chromobacterium haemolyticum]MDH0344364.1 TOBE domain-containing protein [Chromobacterium haemolyticum]